MKLTTLLKKAASIASLTVAGFFAGSAQSAVVTDIELNLNGSYAYNYPAYFMALGDFDFDIHALDIHTDAYYSLDIGFDVWANGYNFVDTFTIDFSSYVGTFSLFDAYSYLLPESALLLNFFSQPANFYAGDALGIDIAIGYIANTGSSPFDATGMFSLMSNDAAALEYLLGDDSLQGEFDITFKLTGDDGQPTEVTEPALITLFGLGLASLAFSRRLKKNS